MKGTELLMKYKSYKILNNNGPNCDSLSKFSFFTLSIIGSVVGGGFEGGGAGGCRCALLG